LYILKQNSNQFQLNLLKDAKQSKKHEQSNVEMYNTHQLLASGLLYGISIVVQNLLTDEKPLTTLPTVSGVTSK